MAGNRNGALVRDAAYRREREAAPLISEIQVRNNVIQALAALPDPRRALAVCQAVERSIREFIDTQARAGL